MPKCIYCLNEEKTSAFNKEHVMPVSFGCFEHNFTLIDTVCKECNDYFSKELELFLARDTYEGALRYKHGIKEPEELKTINGGRLKFKLLECGDWTNAIMRLEYSQEKFDVVVVPVDQVGLRKMNEERWYYFEISELGTKRQLEEQGFIVNGERAVRFIVSPETEEEVRQQLNEKGIVFTNEEDEHLEPPSLDKIDNKLDVEIHGTIDSIIFRGIAKIAFNYFAHIWGRNLALSDNFNDIRNFILHGGKNDFVFTQNRPILHEELRLGIKITDGHMVVLNWNYAKKAVLCRVTLFNWVTYTVALCHWYNGPYWDIASGHHFNINSRRISEMPRYPRQLQPF